MKIKLPPLLPHQQEIANYVLSQDPYDPTLYVVAMAGRQSGKSRVAYNCAIAACLREPYIDVVWISPTETQCSVVFNTILNGNGRGGLQETGCIKTSHNSNGKIKIVFKNGSSIEFRSSGGAKESIRGQHYHYGIIDEAASHSRDFWLKQFHPTIQSKGRKILVVGTPRGRKNWFNELYEDCKKSEKIRPLFNEILDRRMKPNTQRFDGTGIDMELIKHKGFHFDYTANPYTKPSVIDAMRKKMSDVEFKQEILGIACDSAQPFKNIDEIATSKSIDEPLEENSYYGAVDLAYQGSDWTVFTVMDQTYQVVFVDRFNGLSGSELKQRIKNTSDKFQCKQVLIENNGMQKVIIDDLRELHKMDNIDEWNQQNQNKQVLISQLMNACAEKSLRILHPDEPNGEQVIDELNSYSWEFTERGRIILKALYGQNDDCVQSLAMCIECVKRHKNMSFGIDIVVI